MTLSTLIVYQSDSEHRTQIESLVNKNPSLKQLSSVPLNKALSEAEKLKPELIWIHLSEKSEAGLEILKEAKEKNPDLYCIVSNKTLETDLLRASMQAGAFDFLDSQTWEAQIGDVVERLLADRTAKEAEEAKRKRMLEELELKRQTATPRTSRTDLQKMKADVPAPEPARGDGSQMVTLMAILLAIGLIIFWYLSR